MHLGPQVEEGISMVFGEFRCIYRRLQRLYHRLRSRDKLSRSGDGEATPLLTYCPQRNCGDMLSPVLFELLSGVKPRLFFDERQQNPLKRPVYMIIGSILEAAGKDTIVWGAGFQSKDSQLKCKPRRICAVRGPMTRQKILAQGFECPEVYGDPSLLYPLFYQPRAEKTHSLGIVPHYVDFDNPWVNKIARVPGVKIIDIRGNVNRVMADICACDRVASSSLHGIICADAYGVPSTWLELSSKVIGKGFKFRDYFASVGRTDSEPFRVTQDTTPEQIMDRFRDYKIWIDLDKLMEACPITSKHGDQDESIACALRLLENERR